MPHGSGTLTAAGLALLCAVATAVTPPAANAATSPTFATATITDGCGRVDKIEGEATWYVEALLDGKAAKVTDSDLKTQIDEIKKKAASERTEAEWVLLNGYVPLTDGEWRRPMDQSKSFVQVRVLQYDDEGRFEPVGLELAGADLANAVIGTESFRITNDDCVAPLEPTFTDEEGSERDTVTIPQVTGVKYSGKPGTTPGKGTVTVTATPDKGYRFAAPDGVALAPEKTRWSYTFDGTAPVEVPQDKAPVFRRGVVIPATKTKPAGREDNVVIVRHVPGVTWIVDGKAAKTSDKTTVLEVKVGTKTSVEVQAVSADHKKFALSGTTEWVVKDGATSTAAKPALPVVVASTQSLQVGRSTISWLQPSGFPASSKYNVRYREIRLTANQVRAEAPWRAWLQETTVRGGTLKAKPGTIVEVQVQVQAVAGRTVSPWSKATTVWYPSDISRAPGKTWRMTKQSGALGGTMAITPQRTSAWTVKTPTTDRVMIWFGTSPAGAPATIYVDGKRVATVNTRHKHTKVRQVLKPIPVAWGRHVVTVVHTGPNGKTLRLDGVAFGR